MAEAPDQFLKYHEAAGRNPALEGAIVVLDNAADIPDIVAPVNLSIAVEYLAPAPAKQTALCIT